MTRPLQITGLGAVWLAFMVALGLLYLTVPPSPDQSQFDWMAYMASLGLPFYAHSFDMNWPGAMWLHQLGIEIFGVQAWTWRLTDFLFLAVFCGAGALFLRREGMRLASPLYLFLYPVLYITAGSWMAGQRDIIAGGFLVLACALLVMTRERAAGLSAMAGMAVAAAMLIRPTYGIMLLFILLIEVGVLVARHQSVARFFLRGGAFLLGVLIPFGAAILSGLALENLDDWFEQSVVFSFSIYSGGAPQSLTATMNTIFVVSWHWITALGVAGLGLWALRARAPYAFWLIAALALSCFVSYFVQNKGFGYHLGGLLPVLTLGVCVLFNQLFQIRATARPGVIRGGVTGILALFVLVVLAGSASKLENLSGGVRGLLAGQVTLADSYGLTEREREEIVGILAAGTRRDETITVYGTNYDLPYRASRRATYRFFTPAADLIDPNFPLAAAWLKEIDVALETTPPRFVIVDRKAIAGGLDEPQPAAPDRLILSRLLEEVRGAFQVVFENATLVVYERV